MLRIHKNGQLRGKHLLLKLAIGSVTSAALVFGASAPAMAAEPGRPPMVQAVVGQTELAGKSVTVVGGIVEFDYQRALRSGVQLQVANEFAAGIVAGGGGVARGPASTTSSSTAAQAQTQALKTLASNCQGRKGASKYWWGSQLRLNSCGANVLINAIWAGAGLAALAGIITAVTGVGGIAGAVVAALLTIGAGVLGVCASWGTGIYINQYWVGPPVCWAQ